MKEGYVEPDKRKKILLLSDDLRFPSGVGTISKELVLGTCHRYNWVQLGAGINHPDKGKVLSLDEAAAKETGVEDAHVKIIPSDGYGDSMTLRQVMNAEKPDAIMIFTDPRYWTWLFAMEREIRAKAPIIYLNIWDDLPYPMYNRSYYRSCDALFGISKQTVNVNRVVLGDEADDHILRYIPHGVSMAYKPMTKDDPKLQDFIRARFGDNVPNFILLYNARNLGRKRAADIILAWSNFCRNLPEAEANRCLLYMHTDVVDNAGTDLGAVVRAMCDPTYCHVVFDSSRYNVEDMNLMYNMSDGVILVSAAEGWGLSVTEALRTGKMFIGTVTGGIQDQMRFEDENGNWINFTKNFPSNHIGLVKDHGTWCIPVFPGKGRALVGSPTTPYIYDDRASIEDISDAILKLYKLPREEREKRGMEGCEWAISDEAGFTSEKMAERFIEGIDATLEHFKNHPRSRYEFMKIGSERPSTRVDYDPVNYSRDEE
jgi:hypothetical protein